MAKTLDPFNIRMLSPTERDLAGLRPVKVLDTTDGMTDNFHPDGLYSIPTFGKVGEAKRNRMLSYVKLNIDIFHPLVYRALGDLKSQYIDIITSKAYVLFDPKLKDFVASDPINGKTGYHYFTQHFKQLDFEKRDSVKRDNNIALVTKNIDKTMFDYFIVMPAGLRDYTLDQNGRPSEDEINALYRKVISIANIIGATDAKLNAAYLDATRVNLQRAVNDIYDYIENMLKGKSKFVMGKWTSRKLFYSTRNVITSYVPETTELGGDRTVGMHNTVVGLYQYLHMTTPRVVFQLKELLSSVFPGPNAPATLVNPKTLKREVRNVDPEYYDNWMTFEGIQSMIAKYGNSNIRHKTVRIDGSYPYLLWRGKGSYMLLRDIDDLPSDDPEERKNVTPITYTELFYLAVYKEANKTCSLFCRYPIAGFGSIYPAFIYLKTTTKADIRVELGPDGQPTGDKALEFPINGEFFHNSLCPSKSHLARLTADI